MTEQAIRDLFDDAFRRLYDPDFEGVPVTRFRDMIQWPAVPAGSDSEPETSSVPSAVDGQSTPVHSQRAR